MDTRIVFAALLSMLLLKKRMAGEQWRAIIIIVCAATVLCLEDAQAAYGGLNVPRETVGMVALGTAAVSAAGGVFVEKYLAEPPSLVAATLAVHRDSHPEQQHVPLHRARRRRGAAAAGAAMRASRAERAADRGARTWVNREEGGGDGARHGGRHS